MILVDTSVWIDHLRQGDRQLAAALEAGHVRVHPFVVGELACGNLKARAEVLGLLQALPFILVASDKEVLFFMDEQNLMGRGIGQARWRFTLDTRQKTSRRRSRTWHGLYRS